MLPILTPGAVRNRLRHAGADVEGSRPERHSAQSRRRRFHPTGRSDAPGLCGRKRTGRYRIGHTPWNRHVAEWAARLTGSDFTLNNLSKQPLRRDQIIEGSPFLVMTWHSALSGGEARRFLLVGGNADQCEDSTRDRRKIRRSRPGWVGRSRRSPTTESLRKTSRSRAPRPS